jgi:hypothetical protein
MSYRRDDASGHAGWLHDALAAEFGADEIFRDINTIESCISSVED